MSKSYSKTRVLVECALMVAIGTVLANIKIFTMPNGGSVTLLSMLPFVLVSFRHGVKWGLFTGLVNGCLQMLLGFWAPPTPTFIYFLGEILLDYLVAFMVLGTAEFFARPFKNRMVGVAVGTAIAGFLRFMCSFLSGVLVWGNLNEGLSAWTYSLVYNASYMLPETLITVVGAVLLIKAAPPDLRPSVHQSLSSPERKSRRRQKCTRRDFFCTNLKKAVDNSPFSWYNNTRRQG